MVDAQRVAVIVRIEELEKNVFDEVVSAKISRFSEFGRTDHHQDSNP